MHYQAIVNAEELATFAANTVEGANGRFVSKLPDLGESLTYEIQQNKLVIIQEVSDETTIVYGKLTYNFRVVPVLFALACAMHRKRILQVGINEHTLQIHVQDDNSRFVAVYGDMGKLVLHERKGLVFIEEEDYVVAVPEEVICSIFIESMSYSIRLFNEKYLVRFDTPDGGYCYFPIGDVFTSETLRNSKYRNYPKSVNLDWDAKRKQIEDFVEEWTK